ncbi:HAM1 protein [Aeromonas diversa CDC 2478-85]|uniref:dITP/XTP pyrophosphatase n=2 Tax=Aeromonas diversa TaxID=502790 RepID=N9U607_9GAMM|nr:XTP/dITP diphosphatase [Aeromonas diversa]ENY73875.1 HAM1 protein [Aeromonas diversa CDC 2478-85]
MNKLVLATGNQKKVKELAAMLADLDIQVVPQSEFAVSEVAETGTTFVENAIIKARHAAKATGLPAVADDSGLEVDLLQGRPGVYSARFASDNATDRDNIDKLLAELSGVPADLRTARFWCVLVFMRHENDPTPLICQASWEGLITEELRGQNGFGYDPVFFVPGEGCTSAELPAERKNQLSHRGQALARLKAALAAAD